MECLKKKFFLLDIKSQIQYGILFVSLCVCLLVFLLIITYSFVMANLSYVDVIEMFDLKETEAIHKINDYYVNYHLINEEMSKISLQWARNLLKNLEKDNLNILDQQEIQNYYVNMDEYSIVKETPLKCRRIKSQCIFYKSIDNKTIIDDNLIRNSEFLQRLYLTLPMFNKILHVKIIGGKNKSKIFDKLLIHSYKMKTSFFILNNEYINEEFFDLDKTGIELFNSYSNNFQNILEKYPPFDYTIDEINNVYITNKTIYQIVEKHPDNFITIDKKKITVSFSLEENNNSDKTQLLNNIIIGQWNSDTTANINNNTLDEFRGIKIVTTKNIPDIDDPKGNKKEVLDSFDSCEYFRYLQKFKNPFEAAEFNSLDENSSITDCFQSNKTKQILNKLINLNKWLSHKYKRKLKIPLFYNHKHPISNSNYKIIKSQYPDEKSLQIFPSDFIIFKKFNLYIFSVSKYSENIYYLIFLRFLAMMMLIILSNLILWIVILFTIFLLVLKLTSKLTNPIRTLIKTLHQINKKDNFDLLKEIEEIKYEDDSSINELFRICKEMIQGGFKVNIERNKDDPLENIDKIYEICEIKLNNLIIREDKIENDFNKNVKNMFNFIPMNIIEENIDGVCQNDLSLDEPQNFSKNDSQHSSLYDTENSKAEDFNLDNENPSFHVKKENPLYLESDDVNLSLIRDDPITSEQRKFINKILSKSKDYDIMGLNTPNERNRIKNYSHRDYYDINISNKSHPFINIESFFDSNLDKQEIKHLSLYSSEKSKENILYLYYDKLNSYKCINY